MVQIVSSRLKSAHNKGHKCYQSLSKPQCYESVLPIKRAMWFSEHSFTCNFNTPSWTGQSSLLSLYTNPQILNSSSCALPIYSTAVMSMMMTRNKIFGSLAIVLWQSNDGAVFLWSMKEWGRTRITNTTLDVRYRSGMLQIPSHTEWCFIQIWIIHENIFIIKILEWEVYHNLVQQLALR
jgi:hypothetical protein